jgi:hypothetical protein
MATQYDGAFDLDAMPKPPTGDQAPVADQDPNLAQIAQMNGALAPAGGATDATPSIPAPPPITPGTTTGTTVSTGAPKDTSTRELAIASALPLWETDWGKKVEGSGGIANWVFETPGQYGIVDGKPVFGYNDPTFGQGTSTGTLYTGEGPMGGQPLPPYATQSAGSIPATQQSQAQQTVGGRMELGTRIPLGGGSLQLPKLPQTQGTQGAPGTYKPSDVAIGATILPNASSRLSGLQGLVDAQTGKLAQVDRTKLAEDMFNQFAEATDPAYKLAMRRATEAGAHAGRIGSGQLRTQYGTLAGDRARELDLAKRGFMGDALKGSIDDEFRKFGALSGFEDQLFGQEARTRGELRGERGYQGGLEEQAFQRALQQYLMERQGVTDRWDRAKEQIALGESGNPANLYASMANSYGFDPSLIMQLAKSISASGIGSSASSAPSVPTIPPVPGGYSPDPTFPTGQLPA